MVIVTENVTICLPRGLKDEVLSHVKKFSPFVETAIREKIERDYKLSTQEAIQDKILTTQAEISKLKLNSVELQKAHELTDWFASWPAGDQVEFKRRSALAGKALEIYVRAQWRFEKIYKRTTPFYSSGLTDLEFRQLMQD